jgi:hypothetical protein
LVDAVGGEVAVEFADCNQFGVFALLDRLEVQLSDFAQTAECDPQFRTVTAPAHDFSPSSAET